MHPQYLSNTYLMGQEGGAGFFVDAGGPVGPLIHAAERHEMTPTHVLLTHRHHDHVSEVPQILERWPDAQVLIHPAERDQVETATGTMEPGQTVRAGGLDPEGSEPCTALGDPATLILLGDDYDGGHKAWVRWQDGSDDIVPGSQVKRG